MAYSKKLVHYWNDKTHTGSFGSAEKDIGTGIVGSPSCGDVLQLQIRVANGVIQEVKFKTYGCGSAIASSALVAEWLEGKSLSQATSLQNAEIVRELALPPIKTHCSVLAKEAILAAVTDYRVRSEN